MLRSILQNSTAGFYLFASDSTTPTSGKTGLSITATLSKGGGTANAVAPTFSEIGNGLYWVAPSASHRDTLGEIAWQFAGTGAIIAPRLEKVVAVNDQTARFGAAAAGDAMALTSGERTTFAGVLEAAMLNDADGEALLAGMTTQLQSIFDQAGDVPIATLVNLIVSGVWSNATRTLTALSNVTVGGYATGQDPATLLSSTVTKVSTIDALLAAMTEVVEAVTRFKATALSQAPSGGGGGGSGDAEQETLLEVQDTVNAISAALAGAPVEPTGRIASGGAIVAYIGDDFRVRSGTELEIPVSDPSGGLYTALNAIGVANLAFGASRPEKAAGAITGTIASLATSGSGASQLLLITVEITNCGSGLKPGDDYTYQIEQRQTQGTEVDSFVEIEGSLELRKKVV